MITADRATTGIGSLPHHNIDAALAYSFKMGIPFLPQIPMRNPWEFMIAQTLEGLPGLQAEENGLAILNEDIWFSRTHELSLKLTEAFSRGLTDTHAFESFEPTAAISSSWQPFIWELAESKTRLAKIQIAGPITAQWALKLDGGSKIEKFPDLSTQIYRLTLARALAMTRRLQSIRVQPLLYIDEPGLYGFSSSNPRHVLALQELKLLIQTLRKEGVLVGLHCCSNTDWAAVLGLGIHYLSLDTELSLASLLSSSTAENANALKTFISGGGRLSLGVIPTARSSVLQSLNIQDLFASLLHSFGEGWGSEPALVKKTLSEAIYTPACGLALHSVPDAELVLEALHEFYEYCLSVGLVDQALTSRIHGSA